MKCCFSICIDKKGGVGGGVVLVELFSPMKLISLIKSSNNGPNEIKLIGSNQNNDIKN